jgi:hypothetical protein
MKKSKFAGQQIAFASQQVEAGTPVDEVKTKPQRFRWGFDGGRSWD